MEVVKKLALRISYVNHIYLGKSSKQKKILNSTKFKLHLIRIYEEIEVCINKKYSVLETIERLQILGVRINYFKCVEPKFRTIEYNGALKKKKEMFIASLIYMQNTILMHLLNIDN